MAPIQSTPFSMAFGGQMVTGRQVSAVSPELGGDYPLIIAIHGGSYTSAYFDVPGFSLLARTAGIGVPVIALDRPGYGGTTPLPPALSEITHTADWLETAIGHMWEQYGGGAKGVFLIGHSIGGAMTISLAALQPSWPLLGIAVSGVGLLTTPGSNEQWAALPDTPFVDLPSQVKDFVMFGPDWTFAPGTPLLTHFANAPAPKAELLDITSAWHDNVRPRAARVKLPVHYRQGEFDRLWVTGPGQAAAMGAAFTASPYVDAREFTSAGHCIDFHRLGAAFHYEQLAFALRCCVVKEG